MRISGINNLNFNRSLTSLAFSNIKSSKMLTFQGKDEYMPSKKVDEVKSVDFINDETFKAIIDEFKQFPQVRAIAIAGSKKANTADKKSDIDVDIIVDGEIPVEERLKLVKKYSSNYEVGGEYFGPDDEFYVDKMGQQLDVVYADKNWMEDNVKNVWQNHNPSNGYTTCFLFTLKNCESICDKDGWLAGIKKQLATPYPQELKENIIKRNMMLLKDKPFASYYEQIKNALGRNDYNSVNHRIAAFMASYFDILFANNEMLHPGEKKLVKYAKQNCKVLPEKFEENINSLLTQPNDKTLQILDDMVEKLRATL